MIRTLLIIVWTIMATIFWGSITILASFLSKTRVIPHKIARLWGQSILLASGIKVAVNGLSNIHPGKSYIYMPNHKSNFDIPVLMDALPGQFRWLAKVELFKIPLFGYAMKRAGCISINRSDRESAVASLNQAARIIKQGVSVLIFPEGTRSSNNSILPFKKGGFVLAIETQVPIVPVVIHGTGAIMPKKQIRIQPQEVVVELAAPIQTAKYSKKTMSDLMEKVHKLMRNSFEKSDQGRSPC